VNSVKHLTPLIRLEWPAARKRIGQRNAPGARCRKLEEFGAASGGTGFRCEIWDVESRGRHSQ
jgi:hypothetical protein